MNGEMHDWGFGPRLTSLGLEKTASALKEPSKKEVVLDQGQIEYLIPHRGKWLFLKEIHLREKEAVAVLDLVDYFSQVNKILIDKGRIKTARNENFLIMSLKILESDCEGHFDIVPGHFILDLFEIGAGTFLSNVFGLTRSRGKKFSSIIRPGDKIRLEIKRESDFFFSGEVFKEEDSGGKPIKPIAVWEGFFQKREKGGLWLSPLHSVSEVMAQASLCLRLWDYWQRYGRDLEPAKVFLRESLTEVHKPLDARHKEIVAIVRMISENKKHSFAEFQGMIENNRIAWNGTGVITQ